MKCFKFFKAVLLIELVFSFPTIQNYNSVISMKLNVDEIKLEMQVLADDINDKLNILDNGIEVQCDQLLTTVPKVNNRDFKLAYCNLDHYGAKTAGRSLLILREKLKYEQDKFDERMEILRISLNDVPIEEKKINIINYGYCLNKEDNKSFRETIDIFIQRLNSEISDDVNDDFVDVTKGIKKLLFHKSEDIHVGEDDRNQLLIKDDYTNNVILSEKNQPLAIQQLFSMLTTQTMINQLNEKVDLISKVNEELLEGFLNPEVTMLTIESIRDHDLSPILLERNKQLKPQGLKLNIHLDSIHKNKIALARSVSKNKHETITSSMINVHLIIKTINYLSKVSVESEVTSNIHEFEEHLDEEIHQSEMWEILQSGIGLFLTSILLALIVWVRSTIQPAPLQFELLNQH